MNKQEFLNLAAALPVKSWPAEQENVLLFAVSAATEVDDFCQRTQDSWQHFGKEGATLLPVWRVSANPEYIWDGWLLSLLAYRRFDGKIFRGFALSSPEGGDEFHHFLEEVEDSDWCAVLHCAPDTAATRQFAANAGALLPGVSPDADLPLSLLTRW